MTEDEKNWTTRLGKGEEILDISQGQNQNYAEALLLRILLPLLLTVGPNGFNDHIRCCLPHGCGHYTHTPDGFLIVPVSLHKSFHSQSLKGASLVYPRSHPNALASRSLRKYLAFSASTIGGQKPSIHYRYVMTNYPHN